MNISHERSLASRSRLLTPTLPLAPTASAIPNLLCPRRKANAVSLILVEMKDKAASAIGIDVEKPAENTTVKASGDVKDEALNKAKDVKAEAKGKATEVKEKVS